MRRTTIVLMAGCALVATGCYDFASPLDAAPQLEIDQALVGGWRCLPAEPADEDHPQALTIVFARTGERTYDIDMVTPIDWSEEPVHVPAYPSRLDGSTFLNINTHSESKPWRLVRYSYLRPNIVLFELVNEAPIRDDGSPAALRRELIRVGESTDVYEDLFVCVRGLKRK